MGQKPVVGDHQIGFSLNDCNLIIDLAIIYNNTQQLSLSVGIDPLYIYVVSALYNSWIRPFPNSNFFFYILLLIHVHANIYGMIELRPVLSH